MIYWFGVCTINLHVHSLVVYNKMQMYVIVVQYVKDTQVCWKR